MNNITEYHCSCGEQLETPEELESGYCEECFPQEQVAASKPRYYQGMDYLIGDKKWGIE